MGFIKIMDCKQVVKYNGHLAKSGKTVINFAGIELAHLSKKADKSDLLVHVNTGAILRSYPQDTNRSVILDDMASSIKLLDHFLDNPESYEVVTRCDMYTEPIKEPESILELVSAPHNISHLDVKVKQTKKSFNIGEAKW